MNKVILTGKDLTIEDLVKVARERATVALSGKAIEEIKKCSSAVEGFIAEKQIIYGVNTGFGGFKDKIIKPDQIKQLQENLIRSHAVGVGPPLSEEETRAALLIRANTLAKGNSGIKLETLRTIIDFLNKDIYPYTPQKGSVGASGDLVPLAHIALVLMGEGEVIVDGKRRPSRRELEKRGIKPIALGTKEGLALINGTAVMTGILALNVYDGLRIAKAGDIIASLSIEGLGGIIDAFDERIHRLRRHEGQIKVAGNIRLLLNQGSLFSGKERKERVQDSYSLRCIPQVHGACRDGIDYAWGVVSREINAVTDNPLIFPREKEVLSGGNFHGEPIALTADFLSICLSELANISERRIAKLLDPSTNNGLPAFLISREQAGLSSGLMIAQYTAASLVAENKVLAHPVSVDSIPTSANQEDHVSFGTIAAVKNRVIIDNLTGVLAIELLCACQAIDFRRPKKLGKGTETAFKSSREKIARLEKDRILYHDLMKAKKLIISNQLLNMVENTIGSLK